MGEGVIELQEITLSHRYQCARRGKKATLPTKPSEEKRL